LIINSFFEYIENAVQGQTLPAGNTRFIFSVAKPATAWFYNQNETRARHAGAAPDYE